MKKRQLLSVEQKQKIRYTIRKTNIFLVEHTDLSAGDILRRVAFPFLLFSAVLASLLLLSWLLLVPRLASTEVGGVVRSATELREYKESLETEISSLEGSRTAFLLPVHHELYSRIKVIKRQRDRFQDMRRAVARILPEVAPDNPDAIHIAGIYYHAQKRTAEIRGEVRNVGPRSMTVLARFLESLKRIPFVISVESSRFTRLQRAEGEYYTPFTIHVQLNNV